MGYNSLRDNRYPNAVKLIKNNHRVFKKICRDTYLITPSREKVLEMRFGFDDENNGKEYTMQEIANMLGCSKTMIEYLQNNALYKLEKELRS